MRAHLNDIDVFVTAVQSQSFAQAAAKLHVTPSAVGKTIARLERRLGVRLFNRTTRSQNLTDEGAFFYEHCQRAVQELQNAEALLERGKLVVLGKLRVSMPVLFGQLCIAPILLELAKEHTQLELDMSFNDRKVDLIEEGFDLAIRNGELPDTSGLVARKLGQHKMTLCAATAYVKRFFRPTCVADLMQYNILANAHQEYILPRELLNEKTADVKPKARFVMDDLKAILDATLAEMGIAWLPYWLVQEYLATGVLTELMPELSKKTHPIHAIWPRTPYLPLKTRLAVDELVEKLPVKLSVIES